MSSDLTPRRAGVDPAVPAAGRSNRRYPVQLDLRYKVLRGGEPLRGIGVTREFSSTEVKFAADQDLPLGALIELSLAWPLRLDGVCAKDKPHQMRKSDQEKYDPGSQRKRMLAHIRNLLPLAV